jgi:hypothetical protein
MHACSTQVCTAVLNASDSVQDKIIKTAQAMQRHAVSAEHQYRSLLASITCSMLLLHNLMLWL